MYSSALLPCYSKLGVPLELQPAGAAGRVPVPKAPVGVPQGRLNYN